MKNFVPPPPPKTTHRWGGMQKINVVDVEGGYL